MKLLIAGGTGLIGTGLHNEAKTAGLEVLLLTRKETPARTGKESSQFVRWNGRDDGEWMNAINEVDAVVNLSGVSMASGRWTKKRKEMILSSRLDSTNALVRAIRAARRKPSVFLCASAVGYYGESASAEFTENSPAGEGFTAEVCSAWERAATRAEPSTRTVRCRFGVVLDPKRGALVPLLLQHRLFAGGPLGSGAQWFSWIHRRDAARAILFALQNEDFSGAINMTSPLPLRMKDVSRVLGRVLHRPSSIPTPPFVLRLVLGELADMLLTGQKVLPKRLQEAGFTFLFPTFEAAVLDLLAEAH